MMDGGGVRLECQPETEETGQTGFNDRKDCLRLSTPLTSPHPSPPPTLSIFLSGHPGPSLALAWLYIAQTGMEWKSSHSELQNEV